MSEAELRPRYKYVSQHKAKQFRQLVLDSLKNKASNPLGFQQRSVHQHIIVVYPKKLKHFWSPTMDINIEPTVEEKSLVRMLIGPEPSIWTMFIFFYTLGGLLILGGMVLGSSQYILGHGSWYFLLMPLGAAIIAVFWLLGLAGKKKAQKQMRELKSFIELATNEPVFHQKDSN